jgi:hypothetical protein
VKETCLVVAGTIRRELQELVRVADRVGEIWDHGQGAAGDYYLEAAAFNLYAFYAGLERIFEVTADGIDRSKFSGPQGRHDLLSQMAAEVDGVRPPVISLELSQELARYRGFHHVVRDVFPFGYDPERLEALVEHLPGTVELACRELSAFADFLEALAGDR